MGRDNVLRLLNKPAGFCPRVFGHYPSRQTGIPVAGKNPPGTRVLYYRGAAQVVSRTRCEVRKKGRHVFLAVWPYMYGFIFVFLCFFFLCF